ncbi:MAG: amidase family protein [Gemmatimonadota bacterium]
MNARTVGRIPKLFTLLAGLGLASLVPAPTVGQVEVTEATIDQLQAAMAAGSTSAAEITRAYLDRIEAYDRGASGILSVVWINPEAVSDAEAMDRERAASGPRGPLHGIPILLKDNYDTFAGPTTAGTLALATNVAPDDAFQVARLRQAGAIILGKTNMHELASGITTISSLGGQTLNPYDPRRNPGGSSGGTGAAIAASFAAVGWGSDTCGSIRIPAAQNDLVGLRPTKGLSSIDGIIPLSHTQDVGGPLARTVRDLAIALDATVGWDESDSATDILRGRSTPVFVDALDADALSGVRIGILEDYFGSAAEDAAAGRLVRTAIERVVELGADTVTFEIPDLDSLISGSGLIGHEFRWDMMDYLATTNAPASTLEEIVDSGLVHEALASRMRARLRTESRDSEAYRAAFARRAPLRAAVEGEMNRRSIDAFVFPTLRRVPALIGEPQRGSSCSLSANTGLPSISIPVGFTEGGLPIGMEMVGRTLHDARLVGFAYAFEVNTDHRRTPWTTPPLLEGGPRSEVSVAAGSPAGPDSTVGFDLEATYRPLASRLDLSLRVRGPTEAEIVGAALQVPESGGAAGGEGEPMEGWMVIARLALPGESVIDRSVVLSASHRAAVEAGEARVILLTRAHPLGARWVRLMTER